MKAMIELVELAYNDAVRIECLMERTTHNVSQAVFAVLTPDRASVVTVRYAESCGAWINASASVEL